MPRLTTNDDKVRYAAGLAGQIDLQRPDRDRPRLQLQDECLSDARHSGDGVLRYADAYLSDAAASLVHRMCEHAERQLFHHLLVLVYQQPRCELVEASCFGARAPRGEPRPEQAEKICAARDVAMP